MIKKLSLILSLIMAAFIIAAPVVHAETMVDNAQFGASATVGAINTLDALLASYATGDEIAGDTVLNFNNTGAAAWSSYPDECIRVSVNDNAVSWRLRMYTNNFVTPPSTHDAFAKWGYNYGGLVDVGVSSGCKVSMGWKADATSALPATFGNPSTTTETLGWMFVKDISDVSMKVADDASDPDLATWIADPANTGAAYSPTGWDSNGPGYYVNVATTVVPSGHKFVLADWTAGNVLALDGTGFYVPNSDFNSASGIGGYSNVAFGAANYTQVVKPEVAVTKGISLTPRSAPFFIKLEADFSMAAANVYTGTLVLDLLNQ